MKKRQLKYACLLPLLTMLSAVPLPAQHGGVEEKEIARIHALSNAHQKLTALIGFAKSHPRSSEIGVASTELIAVLPQALPNETAAQKRSIESFLDVLAPVARANAAVQIGMSASRDPRMSATVVGDMQTELTRLTPEAFSADFEKEQNRSDPESPVSLRLRYRILRGRLMAATALTMPNSDATEKRLELLREAIILDPYNSAALRVLSADALSKQQSEEALRYVAQSYLAHPNQADYGRVKELFGTQPRNLPANDLDGYLDQVYARYLPNPVSLAPTEAKVKGPVLLELLAGSGCLPCVGVDLATEALRESYRNQPLSMVTYDQSRPRPDPLATDYSNGRYGYYRARGVPTYVINGAAETGGEPIESAQHIADILQERLHSAMSEVVVHPLEISATRRDDRIDVRLGGAPVADASKLTFRLLLLEDNVVFSGENGIRKHINVERAVFTAPLHESVVDHTFVLVDVAAELKSYHDAFEHYDARYNPDGTYRWAERKEAMVPSNLRVIALVQDDDTKAVVAVSPVVPLSSVEKGEKGQ